MKHDYATSLVALGLDPTPARLDRLEGYETLLRSKAVPLGMIAHSDAERLATRHIEDALRGAPVLGQPASVADLGSGAGLPGVPLAIVTESSQWHLVEPRRRRAAFLELVRDELELANVQIIVARGERLGRTVDVAVARALAEPTVVWRIAEPLLSPGGRLLLWLGASTDPGPVTIPGVDHRLVTSPVAEMGPIAIMTRQ